MTILLHIFCLSFVSLSLLAQPANVGEKTSSNNSDTLYIVAFTKRNDIRVHYGSNGSSLVYGSKNQTGSSTTTNFYNNVNDVLGFGLSYKIIDFDFAYSPQNPIA